MRFRGSRKSLIAGLLLFALARGTAGLLTWLLVKLRHDPWSGPLLLQLLLLAPAAVGFVLYVLKAWIDRMRAAFAWCELSPSVITVGGVFARREVAWSDVVDFELTPATFPRPPRQLVLVPRNGDPVAVPFSLRPEAEFRAQLQASFPPMADHGLERVRLARPAQVPSILAMRWRRHRWQLLACYGAAVFLALSVFGGWHMGRDYVNCLRIRFGSPATVEGRVTDVALGDKTAHVRVRYRPPGGPEVRLRREVSMAFARSYYAGNPVTIEYLPHRPTVGRIRDWDNDGLQWIFLLMMPAFAFGSYLLLRESLATWLRPLREPLRWTAERDESAGGRPCTFRAHACGMETLRATLPQRHRGGALVIGGMRHVAKDLEWDAAQWAKVLRKAGVTAREAGGSFVVLERDEADRLLGRLHPPDIVRGNYAVLDAQGGDAEQFALLRLADDAAAGRMEALRTCRVFCWNGVVGPFSSSETADALGEAVTFRLRQLYGGALPAGAEGQDFARLLQLDATSGDYHLMIERHPSGPRLWARAAGEADARYADLARGRWTLVRNQRVPPFLREPALWPYRLFFGPLWALSTAVAAMVAVIVWPPTAWTERQRRRKLQTAREGALGGPAAALPARDE